MNPDFSKSDGLIPVVIQDDQSHQVLMLGYMDAQAFEKTKKEGLVTFYSRSRQRLWTKGESSQHYLKVKGMELDCDKDTILIKAEPQGPTCHMGTTSCFGDEETKGFLYKLEQTISQRIDNDDPESYTNKLFKRGINKVAQKVGEEAVELVIESKDDDDDLFKNEAADLLYHFLILLKAKKMKLEDIEEVLLARSK